MSTRAGKCRRPVRVSRLASRRPPAMAGVSEIWKKNRWVERDGLEKAKAILSGAEGTGFGGSFLQKAKKGC